MTPSITPNARVTAIKAVGLVRLVLLFALAAGAATHPLTDLGVWHLIFVVIIGLFVYDSFSKLNIAFMLYGTMAVIYWAIVPILQSSIGVGYYTWKGSVAELTLAGLVWAFVHFAGLTIGSRLKLINISQKVRPELPFSAFGIASAVVLMFAFIGYLGFELIIAPRREQSLAIDASSYEIFLRNVVRLIPPFLIVYFILEGRKTVRAASRPFIGFFMILLLIAISNPINTARFISLYGILLIVLAYCLHAERMRLLAWIILLTPAYAIFALSVTSAMRSGFGNINASALVALQSLEFSTYSIFLDALKIDDFMKGNYLASHLFIVIPTDIWHSKAGSIGTFVAEVSGYVYTNVGLNSFFNAYADYGLVGLFVMSVLYGSIASNLNPSRLTPSFRSRKFIYGIICSGISPILFRGDLSTAMIAVYASTVAYEGLRFLTRFN